MRLLRTCTTCRLTDNSCFGEPEWQMTLRTTPAPSEPVKPGTRNGSLREVRPKTCRDWIVCHGGVKLEKRVYEASPRSLEVVG